MAAPLRALFTRVERHPNNHDYSQLLSMYGHTDATNTATMTAPQGRRGASEDGPDNWGRLVRSSRDNRVQIYELDLGGGEKKITHVFWADPERDRRGQDR